MKHIDLVLGLVKHIDLGLVKHIDPVLGLVKHIDLVLCFASD